MSYIQYISNISSLKAEDFRRSGLLASFDRAPTDTGSSWEDAADCALCAENATHCETTARASRILGMQRSELM